MHTEAFVHGKYQVGPFETTVHDGQPWKGRRGIISFYINRQMLAHFKAYGRVKYDAWLAGNTDDKAARPATNPMNNAARSGDTSGLHTGGIHNSVAAVLMAGNLPGADAFDLSIHMDDDTLLVLSIIFAVFGAVFLCCGIYLRQREHEYSRVYSDDEWCIGVDYDDDEKAGDGPTRFHLEPKIWNSACQLCQNVDETQWTTDDTRLHRYFWFFHQLIESFRHQHPENKDVLQDVLVTRNKKAKQQTRGDVSWVLNGFVVKMKDTTIDTMDKSIAKLKPCADLPSQSACHHSEVQQRF
eukprot:COSAG05_NODE_853_length_6963_cov_5.582314_8_plen_297_part_00